MMSCGLSNNLQDGLPPYGGSGLKCKIRQNSLKNIMSPSMRREWIEMIQLVKVKRRKDTSPSMRREWIEILLTRTAA